VRLSTKAEACRTRGWQWILDNLSSFVPADLDRPETLKPIAELSLTYMASADCTTSGRRLPPRQVIDFLLAFFSDITLAHYARKSPALFYPYLMAYLPLRSMGYRLAHLDEALERVRHSGYPDALELLPYRALALAYIEERASLRRPRNSLLQHASATALWRCGNPVYLTIDDVYSVTHTIFYLTDFALRRAPIPVTLRRRQIAIFETLLVDFCRRSNWDVVGELLIGLVAFRATSSAAFFAGAGGLLDVWRDDGALPALRTPKARGLRFRQHYHTTLVGLLFCNAYCRLS